jgi:peroxiredoxin Q/BCP
MAKKVAKKKVTKKVTKKAPAKKAVTKKVVKKVTPKKETAAVIQTPSLRIGDMAPEFVLEDQNGKKVALKDFRGQNVVVYFYPKAMTPGCTVQACSLRDSESKLNSANIVVLGISADPVKKLKQFETKDKLNFTLLSDPDHRVIEAYGSWGLKKFMGREYMGILRQSFLIDGKGKIVHVMHKVATKTHHDDVLNVFKNLK